MKLHQWLRPGSRCSSQVSCIKASPQSLRVCCEGAVQVPAWRLQQPKLALYPIRILWVTRLVCKQGGAGAAPVAAPSAVPGSRCSSACPVAESRTSPLTLWWLACATCQGPRWEITARGQHKKQITCKNGRTLDSLNMLNPPWCVWEAARAACSALPVVLNATSHVHRWLAWAACPGPRPPFGPCT